MEQLELDCCLDHVGVTTSEAVVPEWTEGVIVSIVSNVVELKPLDVHDTVVEFKYGFWKLVDDQDITEEVVEDTNNREQLICRVAMSRVRHG